MINKLSYFNIWQKTNQRAKIYFKDSVFMYNPFLIFEEVKRKYFKQFIPSDCTSQNWQDISPEVIKFFIIIDNCFEVFKRYILCILQTVLEKMSILFEFWFLWHWTTRYTTQKFSQHTLSPMTLVSDWFYSILGMYLFGGKFCIFNETRDCTCYEIVTKHPLCHCDRKHFNNILWATVTVFQVKSNIYFKT